MTNQYADQRGHDITWMTARERDQLPETDAEWLYGNSPAGLRMQAAEDLAAEFGTDVSEWTV